MQISVDFESTSEIRLGWCSFPR